MFRSLDSLALGVAALLISAGLLLASVPAVDETVAADDPCPFSKLIIVEPGTVGLA